MKLRLAGAVAAVAVAAAVAAPAAHAASTTVVVAQLAFRGPTGGNDEFIQLKNISSTPQDISGWQIWGSSSTGSSTSARATIPAGVTLPAGDSYLLTNNATGTGGAYSYSVPGDQQYTTGISDNGGLQLRNAAGTVIDAVGSNQLSGAGLPYREGAGLNFPTANGQDAFLRKANGTQDTDDNAADFAVPQTVVPENCGTSCQPTTSDPCAGDVNGITKITAIQTLASTSPCEGKTVKVRGVVTGIDDLYGSSFDAIYKADSGIWLQEATHDPAATTSEGIFVAGIARNAANPTDVIGDNITISGKIVTQFGLVELVPNGVGSVSSPAANTVALNSVATINSTGNPLPAPIVIDQNKAETQDPVNRPYYRSLQGMRVKLDTGTATGGGTTKFRDVYFEPGTKTSRLFRQNTPAADSTPWTDAPAEIGAAPDGGAGNPADPRLPYFSRTEIDMDLFDKAHNVVGPLTYTFDFYEIMTQLPDPGENDGEQPTVERGPINAAYPPVAPDQPANTLRVASFNVENYFPPGEVNDGHTITQAEYDAKTDNIVRAIHNWLKDPDVVAVQEVAVFANGHNALTGLAQKLGNYTPYNAVNNDARGIAPGFLIKNGVTASNPRLLGAGELYNNHSEGTCDLAGGPLFDRAPFALDITKGDLTVTALSNHWASQSHQEPCRVAEAEYVRQQAAALQAQGKNVLVAGDLNDFEVSDSLTRVQQGGVLADQWSKAAPDNRYSYKFDGHLQTLDHILLTAGLASRVSDMRYIHLDNDVYERHDPAPDGSGISDHDPPLITLDLHGTSTSTNGGVSGSVPATLALQLGANASFGAFVPGVDRDYLASMLATVTSTGADASLSVVDASNVAPGHLVNGTFALAKPLQIGTGSTYTPLREDNGPLALKSWSGPTSVESVPLNFKQTIAAGDPLRTGTYAKTLTFTLSTTTP